MKARALTGHPMTLVSSAAELDAALFRLAAVSPVYQPAGPAPDDPADWRLLPAHVVAPHRRDPDKPALARWAAFYPAPGGESAAALELRWIESYRPYLNRMHVDDAEPVQWERKPPPSPRRPWYESDPYWQWFMDGPACLIPLDGCQPWQVAKVLQHLFAEGITEDEIWDACEITAENQPAGPAVPYMAAVARNRHVGMP